jgi:hypothetical protein
MTSVVGFALKLTRPKLVAKPLSGELKPLASVQLNRDNDVELAMRAFIPLATGALLLSSLTVAEAADPVLLAESGAYLLGNAQRCGVSTDRVLRAGRVIQNIIGSLSAESSEKEAAGARFVSLFFSSAHPSRDTEVLVPACDEVVAQFERLERHHRQAGFTD